MKTTLLYGLFGLMTGASLVYADPHQVKENFKQELYNRQRGIMDQEKYNNLIEPYLQEAEKTLEAVKYCMNKPASNACEHYFHHLLHFNVATFYKTCNPESKQMQCNYNSCLALLERAIEKIQMESKKDFNVNANSMIKK